MLMLRLPAPTALHGDALTRELHAAGLVGARVTFYPDEGEVEVAGTDDRAAVERIVKAHVPPPPPPDPDAEFRAALEAATTVAGIKAALLGKTGPGAQARRPDGR